VIARLSLSCALMLLAACATPARPPAAPPAKVPANPDALWRIIQRDCAGDAAPRGSCLAVVLL